jgi:hypothetical protein
MTEMLPGTVSTRDAHEAHPGWMVSVSAQRLGKNKIQSIYALTKGFDGENQLLKQLGVTQLIYLQPIRIIYAQIRE